MEDFIVQLIAKLDTSGVSGDIKEIERKLNEKGVEIKPVINSAATQKELKNLAKQLQNVLESEGLKVDTSTVLSAIKKELKTASGAYDTVYKSLDRLYALKKEYANLKTNDSREAELIRARIKDEEALLQKRKAVASEVGRWDTSKQSAITEKEIALQKELQAIYEKTAQKAKSIKLSVDSGNGASDYSNRIEKLSQDFQKYGVSADEAAQKTEKLKTILAGFKDSNNNWLPDKQIISQADRIEQEFKTVKTSIEAAKLSYDKFNQPVSNEKATSLINRISTFLTKNTKITKGARAELEGFIQEINRGVNVSRWDEINGALKSTENHMRGLGRLGATFSDQMKQATENFTQWLSISTLVMTGVSKTREAITEIKDLDTILTEISKTSDLTTSQLIKLGETSFASASKYGKKASDYLIGVQEMSRSGFYGAKGNGMAEQSLLAQAAGDLSADIANKYVLATNAAYKFEGEAKKLNAVLDGQNMITNRNSVSLEDMAVAMSEVGTVASSYNVPVEDLSAMIGVIESVTKSGGSEAGNALKAILINLQNITSSKIVKTLDAANASMTEMVDGAEKLRNPVAILRDLAETFNKLDEDDPLRAEILTNIGQKFHANKLSALLQNVSMYDKMLKDYSEGEGSAFAEAEKSANNLEGSLNRLSNTWSSTVNNIVNSSALKTGVNTLDGILSLINKITKALGSWGTVGAVAGVALNKKLGFAKWNDKGKFESRFMPSTLIDDETKGFFEKLSKADNVPKSAKAWESYAKNIKTTNESLKEFLISEKEAYKTKDLATYSQYLKDQNKLIDLATLKTEALAAAKNIALNIGVAAAFGLISKGLDALIHAEENAVEKARKVAEATTEQAEKSSDAVNGLLQLKGQLDDNSVSAQDLTKSFKEQVESIPGLSSDIKNLTGDYKDLASAIDGATESALKNARDDAVANVNATGKALSAHFKGYRGTGISVFGFDKNNFGDNVEHLESVISKNSKIRDDFFYFPKSSSAEDIYAYYQSLVALKDEIESLAAGDVNSPLFDTKLYKDTSDAINLVKEDVDSYTASIQRLHEADAQIELGDYLKSNSINSKEAFNSYIDSIKSSSQYSEEYKTVLISVANDAFPQFSSAVKKASEDVSDSTDEMLTSLEVLKNASENLGKLGTAFKEMSDDGYISIKTIGEIKEAVGTGIDNWDEYEKALMSAKQGSDEFNQTMSDLTYAMLDNVFGSRDLSDVTEEQISHVLKENDVLNADTIAHEYLTSAKADAAIQSYVLGDATYEETEALIAEGGSAETVEMNLARLKIAKMQVNQVKISSSEDIDNLLSIANAAGATIQTLTDLKKAKAELSDDFVGPKSPSTQDIIAGTYEYKYNPLKPDDFKVNWGGSNSGTDKNTSKAEQETKKAKDDVKSVKNAYKSLEEQEESLADAQKNLNKTLEDIRKEQHLADFQHQIELTNQELEKFGDNLSMLDGYLDITFEGDYVSKLQAVGTQFKVATEYSADLKSELDQLLNTVPQSADEAKALADQLESLGDKYYENQKAVIKYRDAMYENRLGLIEEMADISTQQTDQLSEIVDRSFKILENGSITGDYFAMPLLSSVSWDAVEKQRRENDQLIAEEQRYRDEIAKIRKQATIMEKAEDDADREEKRQEAYEDFNDKVNSINDSISNIYENISEISRTSTDGVLSEANRMVSGLKSAVDEVSQYAASHGVTVGIKTYAAPEENVNAKADGGITSGLTLVNEIGNEGYIGEDGKLHWFNDGAQVFNAGVKPTKIISADNMRKIVQYTGDKYFREPIEGLESVTAYADGNVSVAFGSVLEDMKSTRGISSKRRSGVNGFVDEILEEVQSAFDNMDISMDAVKQKALHAFEDPTWGKQLKDVLNDDFANNAQDGITMLALQQSSWDNLSDDIQSQLSDNLNVSKDTWDSWVSDQQNALGALQLCKDNNVSSWDLLSPSMINILNEAGFNSKEAWDTFVKQNPLQALQLLIASWDALKKQIQQYMTDMIAIATNGAKAIHAIKIEAPTISTESWNNLQTVIANKIQEVLNAINETFGENSVDLNFNINTSGLTGSPQTNPQGDASGSATGNAAVNLAKQFLGVPYVWGGTTPSGFDCSGLMQYVYAQLGYSIGRTTYKQVNDGTAVDKSNLQPGDLVFFSNNGDIHHVGMYVGNGQFLHAPHTGDVVKISSLSEPHYAEQYYTARRIANFAKGTNNAQSGYSIVGDEYLVNGAKHPTPELIFKTNGTAYLSGISGAETVKLDSGDTVVPYSETMRILKQKNVCATGKCDFSSFAKGTSGWADNVQGTTIEVPAGLGKYYTYMNWDTITNMDTKQGQLIQQAGKNYNAEGYGMIGQRYALAMTSTFGSIGDYVDVYMADGTIIHGILADEKSQVVTAWDSNPANKWGHDQGQSIVEFVVNWSSGHGNPPGNGGVVKVVNLGNYFGDPSFSGQGSASSVLDQVYSELRRKLETVLGVTSTNTNTGGYKFKGYRKLFGRQSKYDFDTPFTSHADGTKNGKSAAKNLMLIGENYKDEIIGYKDGTQEVVNSPTFRKRKDVDYVIGEKDTQKISYAKGYGDMDVVSEMPKLSKEQITNLLSQYKGNMNADDILNAQNSTGISALLILGIAALESGWGSSPIGNNYWGYGATNDNPSGNAHQYGSDAALNYARELLDHYYNGYGLRTLNQMGSGGGNGNIAYAQSSDGVASTTWAPQISSIVQSLVSRLQSSGLGQFNNSASPNPSSTSDSSNSDENREDSRESLINKINSKLTGSDKLSSDTSKYSLEELQKIWDVVKDLRDNEDVTVDKLDDILKTASSLEDIDEYLTKEYKDLLNTVDKEIITYTKTKEAEFDSWKNDFSERFTSFLKGMNAGTSFFEYGKFANEAYEKNSNVVIDQAKMTMQYLKDTIAPLTARLKDAYAVLEKAETATQQAKAIETIESLKDQLLKQQDQYDKQAENVRDAIVKAIEIANSKFLNALSYEDKHIENLQRKIDKSTSSSEKVGLYEDLEDLYKREADLAKQSMNEAHQRQLDMYNSSDEVTRWILEHFKIDEMFDATGETNGYYNEVITLLNSYVSDGKIGQEYVQSFETLVSQSQENKKIWYNAEEKLKNIEDNTKEIASQKVDEKISTYLKIQEKMKDVLDFRLDKQQKEYDAKSALYDLQHTLAENKLDAQVELKSNKTLEQWLDPETRKLLFNDEDYSKYTEGIDRINQEIQDGYKDYIEQINALKPEERYKEDEITAAWERQLAVKQEELEVLKDEMNVAKKTAEYNNAAKEKDTQIILGNRVVNVADPENLHQIAQEREQIVNESELHKLDHQNNEDLRNLESLTNVTQTLINSIQQLIDMINDMPDSERMAWADSLPPVEYMEKWLAPLSGTAVRWLNETLTDFTDTILSFSRTELGNRYDSGIDYQAVINSLPELVKRGWFSQDQADALTGYLQYSRNEKDSTSKGYRQYYDNDHTPEYGWADDSKNPKERISAEQAIENWKSAMQKIITHANEHGGVFTSDDKAALAKYETQINKAIYDNGLDMNQTSTYGEWGSKTFSDWVPNDYMASIQKMENRISSRGRTATAAEKRQMAEWEEARNNKIFDDNIQGVDYTWKYVDRSGATIEVPNNDKVFINGIEYTVKADDTSINPNDLSRYEVAPVRVRMSRNGVESEVNGASIEGNSSGTKITGPYVPFSARQGGRILYVDKIQTGELIPLNDDGLYQKLVEKMNLPSEEAFKMLSSVYPDGVANMTISNEALSSLISDESLRRAINYSYNFGDINITNPVADGNDLIREFMTKINNQAAITNNMTHN